MAVVFYHIPRTSGSSVWHSLHSLALKNSVDLFDLYQHSRVISGSPYFSLDAVWDLREHIVSSKVNALVHHHTQQNITVALPPSEHKYVTILRDPADRLVSEVFLLKALLSQRAEESEQEINCYATLLTSEFMSKAANALTPPDELVLLAAQEPFYRNYYLNGFWQLFFGEPIQGPLFTRAPEAALPALSSTVADRFHFIGEFAQIGDSVKAIAAIAGLKDTGEAELAHIKNGSSVPPLQAATLQRVRDLNAADYEFVDLVKRHHASGLARRLSAAEAEQARISAAAAEHTRISAAAADEASARLAEAEGQMKTLQAELQAMRQSKSWRFTRPLRTVRSLALD